MLLALAGVTGVGKSYFKDKIAETLDFEKIRTIRTRNPRPGEQNGKTGLFVTNEELDNLKQKGEIIYDFNVFGARYAYLKNEVFSDKNVVFEMHYTMIDDWKKIKPDIKTIYILPKDINIPKEMTKKRNLSKEKEEERLREIDEQYYNFINNETWKEKFDFVFYNNYDDESEIELINLVKSIME